MLGGNMPARLVPELNDDGSDPTSDLSALEAAQSAQAGGQPAQAAPAVLDGDGVPEKYRGKTAEELLKIVQDQESYIGRQGQELGDMRNQVGTLRGLVDKSLALRDTGDIGRTESFSEEDLSDDDFITTPRDAVSKTVKRETHQTNQRVARLEQQAAAIDFARRHPTAEQDIEDPAFVQFVQKSQVRTRLAAKAFGDMDNVDFDSAEELWELYEDYKDLTGASQAETTSETETASLPEAASQPVQQPPQMITTGSSGDQGASTKPIYSQAALNRLQNDNPDLYWADDTQAKINEARREGRVLQDV
jgi:hypothetical protein